MVTLPGLNVLRAVPERWRAPQTNIPQTLAERERLRRAVASYAEARRDTRTPRSISSAAARVRISDAAIRVAISASANWIA